MLTFVLFCFLQLMGEWAQLSLRDRDCLVCHSPVFLSQSEMLGSGQRLGDRRRPALEEASLLLRVRLEALLWKLLPCCGGWMGGGKGVLRTLRPCLHPGARVHSECASCIQSVPWALQPVPITVRATRRGGRFCSPSGCRLIGLRSST